MVKLTKLRRQVLEHIVSENDAGRTACYGLNRVAGNSVPWTWLAQNGLIESNAPLSFTYHTVRATPAGRAALEAKEG